MPYAGSRSILADYMTALAAYSWSPFVVAPATVADSILFRRGPQHGLNFGTKLAIVQVGYIGLPGGEQTRGTGNRMIYRWQLAVSLMVPDDHTDPEDSEDRRLDLIDSYLTFVQTNRGVTTANMHRVLSCEHFAGETDAQPASIFRGADLAVELHHNRSEPNIL